MARPPSFDHGQVLDKAMQLFWCKGYANTSIKDLTKVTQLQPGSLYGAYQSKRHLFIQSLDHYFENLYQGIHCILAFDEAPRKRIRRFFDFLLDQVEKDNAKKSCLLVNTLLEIPADDEEINKRVSGMFLKIEQLFCEVLREAKENGTLAADLKPESVAKMLMSGIFGLQVYNRMQPNQKALNDIVNNLLSILGKSE